jgi:hypothetical protein
MKIKIIISLGLVFLAINIALHSQSVDELLQLAQQNNPRIKELKKWLEYEEVKSRTGIYPDNPEVTYIHLWGNPDALGNQQEFEVTQSFKLPGYYKSISGVQKLQFEQKKLLVDREIKVINHELRGIYFEIAWLNKKAEYLGSYKNESGQLVNLMQEGYKNGEISKPELDKAMIFDVKIQNEWNLILSDLNIKKSKLFELTGAAANDFTQFEYPANWELPELDTVLSHIAEKNPDMLMASLSISESGMLKKYEKMNTWPSFTAGYKSESILNQRLQGIHAGITIPLWENKNEIKKANLRIDWSEAAYQETYIQVKSTVSALWNQAKTNLETITRMEEILRSEQVSESSMELLESGQISFHEYILENEISKEVHLEFFDFEKRYYEQLSTLKSMGVF